jgi:hypothetical protein
MPASTQFRRFLYLVACLAPTWAVIAIVTDGITFHIGRIPLKATEPIRPLIIGAAAAGFYVWRYAREHLSEDGNWLLAIARRAAIVATPVVVLLGCIIAVHYGSFTAGGSDSYGYVSQASLWLKGSLRIEQPWVQQFSWPEREWTFAPLGYRPLSMDGTIVPTYAAGLPILMAIFQALFGANGPFLVVPVLASLTLWLTFELGKTVTGSRTVGAIAALLLLSSPVFLAHIMLPMTDVPVAAGWTLVTLLALKGPRPKPLAAGLAAAATLMIRPNLVLLTLAPNIAWRGRPSAVLRFAIGVAPGVVLIAALNTYLYGSPLASGYGTLGDLYGWRSAWPNLKHYGEWLIRAQTPLVSLAIIPLVWPRALRPNVPLTVPLCLAAVMGLTLASYLFYSPFDLWTYLRFLLPGFPVLMVLMAAAIRYLCNRLPLGVRGATAILISTVCVAGSIRFGREQFIFTSKDFEQRHIRAAEYVKQLTPETAIIICVQHSGSLRYYAHRVTLRYDSLYEHRLDTTLNELRAKGYRPYIVLDDWEEPEFRKRFGSKNRAGRLDWKPLVTVKTNPEVRIFDPEGRSE